MIEDVSDRLDQIGQVDTLGKRWSLKESNPKACSAYGDNHPLEVHLETCQQPVWFTYTIYLVPFTTHAAAFCTS